LLDFDPGLFGYYDGFYNQVHIDEKRFFVSKEKVFTLGRSGVLTDRLAAGEGAIELAHTFPDDQFK
jgi:hypothetical protein